MKKPIKVLFLGTGASSGIPLGTCLTDTQSKCEVCRDAAQPDSKNRRCSTSVLVCVPQNGRQSHNIVIDAGKHFGQAALRWFPEFGISRLDSVLLTHAHFDAIGGLDDLRAWTQYYRIGIPVYLRPVDLEIVKRIFFYLVDPASRVSGGTVAKLNFNLIGQDQFMLGGLSFQPLSVLHGGDYVANAYKFGGLVYMSDVSQIPDATIGQVRGVDVLVLDALRYGGAYASHLTIEQALEYIREIRPRKALLTGMSHGIDHTEANAEVAAVGKQMGVEIGLAYDGLCLTLAGG